MIPDLQYGISCPPDWVRLPLDSSDEIGSWAKNTTAELRERSQAAGYELDQRAVRKDLRSRVDDSRSREPFYAFALYPDGFDTALAVLELDLIHPDATVPQLTLDWLADAFSTQDFGLPKTTRIELPVGPAVRIRQNFAADGPAPGGPGVLLETLTYGILPTGTESALMLLLSWTTPGLEEAMEDAADSIVQTLTVNLA
ncbi:hypothetical protein OHB14_30180 [Streptomyces sp. NBC_01613]|uniref:hypothetical protein n=1 Tax=Streptomyces sp. NBC_01613 TaxID=2975896 RepID=UPI0038691E46